MRISRKGWTHGGQGTQRRPVPRAQRSQGTCKLKLQQPQLLDTPSRGFRRRHSYAAFQALISWFSRAEELLQRASLVLASNANHTLLCFFRGASPALEPVVQVPADQEGSEKY